MPVRCDRGLAPRLALTRPGYADRLGGADQRVRPAARAAGGRSSSAACACNVLQPLGSAGPARCVSCGAPHSRWVAHPPPADGVAGPAGADGGNARTRTAVLPRRASPMGLPAGGLARASAARSAARRSHDPVPGLRWAAWLAAATCAVRAGGGRRRDLAFRADARGPDPGAVRRRRPGQRRAGRGQRPGGRAGRAADGRLRRAGAGADPRRRGPAARPGPSRSARGVVARLLVPFWNVYGAGQIVTEIDRMLGAAAPVDASPRRTGRRASRITALWWLSWIVSRC